MPWPGSASIRATAALLAAAAFAAAVSAAAAPIAAATVISLRVESSTAPVPLFDGPVDTSPHAVDGGDGSGPHPCWGSGATPSPTATGALDDALRGAGVSWRGNWDLSFRDFFIERIGSFASAPPDRYWSLAVNGRFTAGGCLATVDDGDAVRFFYGPLFGAPPSDDPATPGGSAADEGQAATGGRAPARTRPAAPARVAQRATRFLRGAEGVGGEWAELALALRGGEPSDVARRLGERLRSLPGRGARIGKDVDSTALVTWALALRGRHTRARRMAVFVRSAQSADGGFPTSPGGQSNTQSTGVALIALRVAGLGPRPTAAPGGPTPLDYLASLARRDGSIAYTPGSSPTPVWTTAQALLGLTSKEKLMQMDTLRQTMTGPRMAVKAKQVGNRGCRDAPVCSGPD
jgi:hypothetical protein